MQLMGMTSFDELLFKKPASQL